MKNHFKFLLISFFAFAVSCDSNDELNIPPTPTEPEDVKVLEFSFDSDENSSLMYQDDEPLDSLYSTWRIYEIGKVVRVKPVDSVTIEVANFAPIDIEDVTIIATVDSLSPIKLFHIKKIRAHAVQKIKYPFIEDTQMFLALEDDAEVDFSDFKEGIDPSAISFDFTGESELVQQLLELKKLKWRIKYHDFNPENKPASQSNWATDMTPQQVRQFTSVLINYGTLYVSDEFQQELLAEHIVGNKGMEDVFSTEQKQEVLNKFFAKNYYRCGTVVNVSGLGGGSAFGMAAGALRNSIKHPSKTHVADIVTHEFMHTIDFGHNSNLTYPKEVNGVKTGSSIVALRVMTKFFEEGRLPITYDNYYKQEDFPDYN